MLTLRQLGTVTIAVCLALAACDRIMGPEGIAINLQTDRTSYMARYVEGEGAYTQYGFTVVAEFQNRGDITVYFARCYPDSPQPIYGVSLVNENDSWGSSYARAWGCVGHDRQIQVDPGEVRTDSILLQGPNAFDGVTGEYFGRLEGSMRLHYQVQTCRGDGACRVEPELTASNVFTVHLVEGTSPRKYACRSSSGYLSIA